MSGDSCIPLTCVFMVIIQFLNILVTLYWFSFFRRLEEPGSDRGSTGTSNQYRKMNLEEEKGDGNYIFLGL